MSYFSPFNRSRRSPASVPVVLDFLHSREHFRDILEVERMRADRTGLPFTLVVFTLPTCAPQDGVEPIDERVRFARHLERRRRATDHIGEMHDRHMGVVLWNTGETGATTFAKDVVGNWSSGEPPEFEVFLYPTYVPTRSTAKRRAVTGEVATEQADEVESSADEREAEEIVATNVERVAAQPLEMLFVRPLPFWKRAVDVVGAAIGLLILSPLFLVVAALVRWTSPGPVLFAQTRTGHGGRPFTIYKFRTMVADAASRKASLREFSEQDGPAFKLARDPRITSIGRVLRKTCIDELPQLWNVLIGDMTLVGPRPLEESESAMTFGWERRRLDVTPGLTCIWQVEGKSKVSFAEWMRMDIRYTRVGSFRRDASLVLRTLLAMLRLRASH